MEKKDNLSQRSEKMALPESSISLRTIILNFVILLLLIAAFLFYLRFNQSSFLDFKFLSKGAISSNLEDVFKDEFKTGSLKGDSFEIQINEKKLKNIVGLNDPNFFLKNPDLKINSDFIVISGKAESSLLSPKIEFFITPEAEEGTITFKIEEIKAAGIVAPSKISSSLSPKMEEQLKLKGDFSKEGIKVEEIKLLTGFVYLKGIKND